MGERERRRGAGRGGGGWKKGGDEQMIRRRVRWVNKKNERMIHRRPAESEKVEQWERRREEETV